MDWERAISEPPPRWTTARFERTAPLRGGGVRDAEGATRPRVGVGRRRARDRDRLRRVDRAEVPEVHGEGPGLRALRGVRDVDALRPEVREDVRKRRLLMRGAGARDHRETGRG